MWFLVKHLRLKYQQQQAKFLRHLLASKVAKLRITLGGSQRINVK
jgi:hypothetical protein